MRVRSAGVLLATALLVPPRAASAQLLGLPVYNSGIPSGFSVAGDVGFAGDNAIGGGGTTYAGTVRAGFGALGVALSAGSFNPSGPNSAVATYGAAANLRLIGGPLIPFSASLQAGYGYGKLGATGITQIPIGLGIGLTIPNPVLAIRPWVAPRAHITRTSTTGVLDASNTTVRFAASAGVEFNLLNGIGAHVSYDRIFTGGGPSIWGVGLHYAFRVPGL